MKTDNLDTSVHYFNNAVELESKAKFLTGMFGVALLLSVGLLIGAWVDLGWGYWLLDFYYVYILALLSFNTFSFYRAKRSIHDISSIVMFLLKLLGLINICFGMVLFFIFIVVSTGGCYWRVHDCLS